MDYLIELNVLFYRKCTFTEKTVLTQKTFWIKCKLVSDVLKQLLTRLFQYGITINAILMLSQYLFSKCKIWLNMINPHYFHNTTIIYFDYVCESNNCHT
jgi:hypothetical protein